LHVTNTSNTVTEISQKWKQ